MLEKAGRLNKLTEKQHGFILELLNRHELRLHFDPWCDYGKAKLFLDAFAFNSEQPRTTGYKRISVVQGALIDGQDVSYIARKLDVSENVVIFVRRILVESGYNLDPLMEDEAEDPEWLEQERNINGVGVT